MAKCVHPSTAVKIQNKSLSVLVWQRLYQYEAGALQYTQFPNVQMTKHTHKMPYFAKKFELLTETQSY